MAPAGPRPHFRTEWVITSETMLAEHLVAVVAVVAKSQGFVFEGLYVAGLASGSAGNC